MISCPLAIQHSSIVCTSGCECLYTVWKARLDVVVIGKVFLSNLLFIPNTNYIIISDYPLALKPLWLACSSLCSLFYPYCSNTMDFFFCSGKIRRNIAFFFGSSLEIQSTVHMWTINLIEELVISCLVIFLLLSYSFLLCFVGLAVQFFCLLILLIS